MERLLNVADVIASLQYENERLREALNHLCTDCGGTGIAYQTEKKCSCQPHHLTTIVKWFQELPLAARRGLSLANLHDLSKRLGGKHDASQTPGANTNLGDTHD